MALQDTDLFVVYRPATEVSYKLQASALGTGLPDGTEAGQVLEWDGTAWIPSALNPGGNDLPDGTEAGQVLEWDGTDWIPSAVIDGGTY